MDSEEECLVNDHQVNKFYLKENSDVTLNPTPTHDAKTCWVRFTCYPEPVLFLVGLGFFSFVPLNQEYLYQRYYKRALEAVGGNSTVDRGVLDIQSEINNTQLIDDIATRVSIYASSNATLFSANMALFRCIPPIFTSILICGSTDSFGRRFGLCLPIIGGIIRALCYLTVEVAGLQLEWLFLGELIDGLFGEHLTFFACSTAYISDVASKESLVLRVIICSTMYIIASSIGNFALGLVIGYVGFAWGIVLVALCYCFALLYVIFVLAESLPKSETKKFTWSLLMNSTVQMYEVLTRQRTPSSDRTLLWLLDLSMLLFSIAFLGTFDVETIFMLGVPFNMDSTHIGVVIGIAMIFWAFVPILRTSLLKRCVSDEATLIITALIAIVAFVIQGFCTTPQQILTGKSCNCHDEDTVFFISSPLAAVIWHWKPVHRHRTYVHDC